MPPERIVILPPMISDPFESVELDASIPAPAGPPGQRLIYVGNLAQPKRTLTGQNSQCGKSSQVSDQVFHKATGEKLGIRLRRQIAKWHDRD
jgi:hypothetical protein